MRRRLGTWLALGAAMLLAGCATTAPPRDLAQGVKTVAFVQHGTTPARYMVNAIDGKTFWGGNAVAFTPGSSSPADARLAGQATVVSLLGSAIAQQALKSDPELYDRTLRKMVGSRSLTSEIAPGVFPALAAAWGTTFEPDRLLVVPNDTPLVDGNGLYLAKDPGTDLILAYGIRELVLSEQLSAGALFKAMGTLGLHDRDVVPVLWAYVSAYKRDDKGALRQVWSQLCQPSGHVTSTISEKWSVLEATPEKGRAMLDAAVPIAVSSCAKDLRPL